jgi:hypothetical protein
MPPPGQGGYGGYGGYAPPPQRPPQGGSNKTLWILLAVGVFGLFGCGILAFVGYYLADEDGPSSSRSEDTSDDDKGDDKDDDKPSKADDDDLGSTVIARDGLSQIRPATGWVELPELHDEATIEWGNKLLEEYLIVLTEPRAAFNRGINLDEYANLNLTRMRTVVKGVSVTGPKRITLGGDKAVQYEVTGSIDFVDIGYVVTYIEGDKAYHQLLAWTLLRSFSEKKPKLRKVTSTFRER